MAEFSKELVPQITFSDFVRTWGRVALLSFGGPAGQIAVMHRIVVDEKKWISDERFLHALNFCMLIPGPEAQQLATYLGWLSRGAIGGIVAGMLFILPGVLCILALSIIYVLYSDTTLIAALFFGLKAAVIAVVIEALMRLSKRVLKNKVMLFIAAISFLLIFFVKLPFPFIILGAATIGMIGYRVQPSSFDVLKPHGKGALEDPLTENGFSRKSRIAWSVAFAFLILWLIPIAVIRGTLGEQSVLYDESIFFSKAAMVTFGGAYSVLTYVGQQAVERFHWLETTEMVDGLGMAETTPGPLIMVLQFVGFIAAYRNPGPFSPMIAGLLGSLVTTWVTFAPCFLWVFAGAPFVERLRKIKLLNAALSCVTAAVVGVVLNLSLWFAMHTLFSKLIDVSFAGMHWQFPVIQSVNLSATAIMLLACFLLFRLKWSMAWTLLICTVAGTCVWLLSAS
jgi:chromate transporter